MGGMSVEEISRVCGFCQTRQPLREMAMSGTSYQCRDLAACQARAEAGDLYPRREDELEIRSSRGKAGGSPVMTSIVLCPLDSATEAVELAHGLWQKRILPVGAIDYKGRRLDFTRGYIEELAGRSASGPMTRCRSRSRTPATRTPTTRSGSAARWSTCAPSRTACTPWSGPPARAARCWR
jgi:hypothetical protein